LTSHPYIPRLPLVDPGRPHPTPGADGAPDPVGRVRRLRSTASAARAQLRRLTQLGWPKRYPLVQFPNAPLILAFLAGQAAGVLHGAPHPYASAVAYLAMIVWAYEELTRGVNLFRNLLGLGYVVSTAVHLAVALHR
jgi:hypothetical protein